jgi:hypothetical protein
MNDLDRHFLHHRLYNNLYLKSVTEGNTPAEAHSYARANIHELYTKVYNEEIKIKVVKQ